MSVVKKTSETARSNRAEFAPEGLTLQPEASSEMVRGSAVHWTDPHGEDHLHLAEPAVLGHELYRGTKLREGNHYPRQRNYHGVFYFSQTRQHIWHESLLEASTLAWLDLHEHITAIAAQPVEIVFPDGSHHFPDFLAQHGDGKQVLYDVKPAAKLKGKVAAQFSRTRGVCDLIGWGYEVRSEQPRDTAINIDWLVTFRHEGHHPGVDIARRLIDSVDDKRTVGQLARAATDLDLPNARSAIYHLIATQFLQIDLGTPISDKTIITRGRFAHA